MQKSQFRGRVINYISERYCKEAGGFCFYRLEEPNGSDTYYALATLKLLDSLYGDDKTVRYLKRTQCEDGTFESIFAAFYVIKSLQLLGESLDYDPVPFILDHVRLHKVENLPAEVTSIFQFLRLLLDICLTLGIELDENWRDKIAQFVFDHQNKDHGFGHPYSTLLETEQATMILKWLSYPVERLSITDFVKECEHPIYGFVNLPRMSPSFIEYIHAGISASRLLDYESRHFNKCIEFISDCQSRTGGFSRATHAGIATLENTYLAIHALSLLPVLHDM